MITDNEPALDVWLRIPEDDNPDGEAEAEANTYREDDGTVRVEWSLTAVGLVTSVGFASYDAAREWLEAEGFTDYTTEGPTIMTQGTVEIADLVPEHERDLVYIDYRDELSPEQVEEIIHEGWSESVDEWASDAAHRAAWELAGEVLERNPGLLMDRDDLTEEIRELDTSNPTKDLLGNTGMTLFRYSPGEDDDGAAHLDFELEDPIMACEALGLGPAFMPAVAAILPEIEGYRAEGGGWFTATFVFSANPADLIGKGERVTIHDPFLWLCNPWAGNGWGEVAEGCTITLPIADIHVDKFAWGYSAHDVFGGLALPDSTITEAS